MLDAAVFPEGGRLAVLNAPPGTRRLFLGRATWHKLSLSRIQVVVAGK